LTGGFRFWKAISANGQRDRPNRVRQVPQDVGFDPAVDAAARRRPFTDRPASILDLTNRFRLESS
jgi:hypothetical protein